MNESRRKFIKTCGLSLGSNLLFPSLNIFANTIETNSDYRALVCVFLYGGNDGNNMIIPVDQYADYYDVRSSVQNLNIAKSELLPIKAPSHNNLTFGLHPNLPELQKLYTSGKLAILCNTGPLVQNISRQDYLNGLHIPDQLFSHSSQQTEWQSASTSSIDPFFNSGWGGRVADSLLVEKLTNKLPVVMTFSGNSLFIKGQITNAFEPGNRLAGISTVNSNKTYSALRTLLDQSNVPTLSKAVNDKIVSAVDNSLFYNSAINSIHSFNTQFPVGSLSSQLFNVAKTIAIRSSLSSQKQIFFVSLNGFDTHINQLTQQANLLKQLSQSLAAFYSVLDEMGVSNNVLTFTMSDFGRTFQPNTNGGSDHGWGNHHLILGGSVKGGDFYGRFPSLKLSGNNDSGDQGRWIPTTSVDQYAATLTNWLGINDNKLFNIFPGLKNFTNSILEFI